MLIGSYNIQQLPFIAYQFVDREKEIKFLKDNYSSQSAELIIIYGRRRVGKTELIKQSISNCPLKALYLLGELQKENQLASIYMVYLVHILRANELHNRTL